MSTPCRCLLSTPPSLKDQLQPMFSQTAFQNSPAQSPCTSELQQPGPQVFICPWARACAIPWRVLFLAPMEPPWGWQCHSFTCVSYSRLSLRLALCLQSSVPLPAWSPPQATLTPVQPTLQPGWSLPWHAASTGSNPAAVHPQQWARGPLHPFVISAVIYHSLHARGLTHLGSCRCKYKTPILQVRKPKLQAKRPTLGHTLLRKRSWDILSLSGSKGSSFSATPVVLKWEEWIHKSHGVM